MSVCNYSNPETIMKDDVHDSECVPVIIHDCWCPTDNQKKVCTKKQYDIRCSEHCTKSREKRP